MGDTVPPGDPDRPAAQPPSPADAPSAAQPQPPARPARRRSRHRILKTVLLLIAGVLIFIAIVPTLLSMGWARRIVENKANRQLRGKLQITNWSLGWFSGARIDDVTLDDSAGQPVLQLTSLDTHLSLTDILRGNFDLGTVPVKGLRLFVTREADGTLNVQKILPSSAAKPAHPAGQKPSAPQPPAPQPAAKPPAKLPNISVDLELSDCQAVFTDATTGKSVTFPVTGSIKIPDINQPITNSLQLGVEAGSASAGTIALTGSIAAIHDNLIDSSQPDVDETLKVSGIDLRPIQPMLASSFDTLAGHGDGEFSLRLKPHAAGMVKGALRIAEIEAAGKATKGDRFSADVCTLTLPQTNLPTAAGLDAFATTSERLTTTSPITVLLKQAGGDSTISFDADAAVSALHNLMTNLAPGSEGKVELTADVNLPAIANQLPHLIRLRRGMKLQSGEMKGNVGIAMSADDATPTGSLAIDNVVGTDGGKSVSLKPITCSASVRDLGGGGGVIPKLVDLKAELSSAFAVGSLNAPTPSEINGQLTAQLADVEKELGQVFDFGALQMSGAIAANISSQVDMASEDTSTVSAALHGALTGTNLRIDRGSSAPIDVPSINYTLAGNVVHSKSLMLQKISGLDLSGTVGPPDRPAIATHFSTDLAFSNNSSVVASNINATASVVVPELRKELGSASASEDIPADYTLKCVLGATMACSRDGSNIDIPTFGVTDNHGLISIQRSGNQIIRFATGKSRERISPDGGISLSADLAGLDAIFASKPTLHTGRLAGEFGLSGDAQRTEIQGDLHATDLTVRGEKGASPIAPVECKTTVAYGPGDELTVSDFSVQGAGGDVHLKEPMVIAASDSGKMAINAELVGKGDIAQAMSLYAAVDTKPPSAQCSGTYSLDEQVSTENGLITLKGSVQADLTLAAADGASFREPNFSLVTDLSYDQIHDAATLSNFLFDMHATGALRISAHGQIADLTGSRTMNGVSAELHYDSDALWKLIYATLSKEKQKSYNDVKLSGTVDRVFVIAGSYPAHEPFNVAVKSLNIHGGIALPNFQGKGMTIANLDLPISLQEGVFLIAEPTPASMNDGTLSLNGINVDLSDPHERLNIPNNSAILHGVSLNPVFVQNAAGWINNPLFVGADKAAGVLDLVIDYCSRLPTDDLLKANTPDNDGKIHLHMTLGRVQIGAPMLADVSKDIGPILGGKFDVPSLQGEIPNYTVDIARGIMTTDMTMNLTQHKRPLKLSGTVALASEKLNMTLDLPTGLFGGESGPLAQAVGESLQVPITGTVDHPHFDAKSLIKKNLKNPGKDLNNLLKGIGG